MHIYIYIYGETRRHLKFCYISILTNLLRSVRKRFVRIEISKYNKILNASLFHLYFLIK